MHKVRVPGVNQGYFIKKSLKVLMTILGLRSLIEKRPVSQSLSHLALCAHPPVTMLLEKT